MIVVAHKYGLLPPLGDATVIYEQMRIANQLWNQLVETEQRHQQGYVAATATDPAVAAAAARLEALQSERADLVAEKKRLRIRARAKITPPEIEAQIAGLRPRIKEAAEALRTARKAARERVRPELQRLEAVRRARAKHAHRYIEVEGGTPDAVVDAELAYQARRAAGGAREMLGRALPDSPLYWGTANAVLSSYETARQRAIKDGAELHFHGFRGAGRLVNQIIGGLSLDSDRFLRGVPVTASEQPGQVRFSVDPLPPHVIGKNNRTVDIGARHTHHRYGLSLALGSERATWPLILHRPLPERGSIQEVIVCARKIGPHTRWHVVFLCRVPDRELSAPQGATVAVNCGWRSLKGEGLRVATIVRRGDPVPRYVILPAAIIDGHDRLAALQSERDAALNAIWPLARSLDVGGAPEAIMEAHARLCRSPKPSARSLTRLALAWREHQAWRPDIYRRLEEWRRRDKAMWSEWCHSADKLAGRRRDAYHQAAISILAGAGELIVDAANWADLARVKNPEGKDHPLHQRARFYRRIAAVGELMAILRHQAAKRGVPVIAHEGPTTWRCHVCGHDLTPSRPEALRHQCPHCLRVWDQDVNNARRKLADLEAAE